jgi:hypothetical protein
VRQTEYSLYVWTGYHVWVDLDGEKDRNQGTAALSNNAWALHGDPAVMRRCGADRSVSCSRSPPALP